MTNKKKTTSEGSKSNSDKPADGGVELDLGGLFRGFGNVVDLLGKLADAGEGQTSRQGQFRVKGLGDQAKGVYGFSIRSGLGGTRPTVEPFGNVHAGSDGLEVGDVREPLVDIYDESNEIVITAELPGVTKEDISVETEANMVKIKTSGERYYVKEVSLPCEVKTQNYKQSYNNGVLELRLIKTK